MIISNFNIKATRSSIKIANICNDYFSSIGMKNQANKNFWNKSHNDYLLGEIVNSFLSYQQLMKKLFQLYPLPSFLKKNKSLWPKQYSNKNIKFTRSRYFQTVTQYFSTVKYSYIKKTQNLNVLTTNKFYYYPTLTKC